MKVRFFISCFLMGTLVLCLVSIHSLGYNPFQPDSSREEWQAQKNYILSDQESIVANDFDVPESLKKRVGFWFDIYSRYSGYHKVIHHNLYPWIVYEVVDTRGLKNSDKHMRNKIKAYKKAFKQLSKKRNNFTMQEKKWLKLFSQASDKRKALRTAASKIRYQTGQRDSIEAGLLRSQHYLPYMEELFTKNNLPTELTRLPFVESSFNWNVYSRVGAAGMWQFMKRTGRKFLRINRSIDERMSPLKSTQAAARLLAQNRRILYNSWPLAITAYNHGPTGLRRAVRKTGSRDLSAIITHYKDKRFSFASSNFYSSFLAVLYVEKYKTLLFPEIPQVEPHALQERIVSKRVKAKDLLEALNFSSEDFLRLNPDFDRAVGKNEFIPQGTKYYIPGDQEDLVADNSI